MSAVINRPAQLGVAWRYLGGFLPPHHQVPYPADGRKATVAAQNRIPRPTPHPTLQGYVAPLRIGSATATTTPEALVATLARLRAPWAVFGRSATARWPARAWSAPTTVAGVVVGEGPAPAAVAVQNALLLAPGVPLPEAWGVTVAANAHGWQAAVTMTGVDNITAAAVNELAAVTLPDVLPAARRAGVAVDGAATTRLTAASVAPTGQAGPLVFLPDLAAVPTGGSALLFSGNRASF